jgi:hypothetical protein
MGGSGCGSCPICKITGLLVILGAINWGLVGAFDMNLVTQLLGGYPTAVKVVYILIGVSGVLGILKCFKCCPCQKKSA